MKTMVYFVAYKTKKKLIVIEFETTAGMITFVNDSKKSKTVDIICTWAEPRGVR